MRRKKKVKSMMEKKGEAMNHEIQAVSLIITAIIIAMLCIMISLPVSYYDVAQYQPASLVPEPSPQNTTPPQTVVTIVYTTQS
jgi:hypothetical protein